MSSYTRLALIGALCLISAYACGHKETDPGPTSSIYTIENVPFVKQKDEFCGPAAMATVTAHYGKPVSQQEAAETVYTPALSGALISDMENYARDRGFTAATENGSLDSLKTLIDQGRPVILLVDKGKWRVSVPHYYVAYGYVNGGESFIVHTGYNEGVEIDSQKLDNEWERMNRLMLVIEP